MAISRDSHSDFDRFNGSNRSKKHQILRCFSPETNRGVLLTLGLLTFFLAILGGSYIKWCEQPLNTPNLHLHLAPSHPMPSLQTVQTDAMEALAISAGLLNDFFVLTEEKLLYYHLLDLPQSDLQVRKRCDIPLDKRPTASCFIMKPDSPFYGKLFVAFTNSVTLFDPETMEFTPYVEFGSDTAVTGLASDGYDLYAADSGLGIFYCVDIEKKVSPLGLPDERTGFGGFLKGSYSFFDLDVAPKSETIYVTHPDQFRIEAFSVLDGHWKEGESFEKKPPLHSDYGETFTGPANPASIIVLGDGSFLTTDAGPEPNVKSWHADGSFQAEISLPEINAPIAADQAPLATITFTESRAVRLLILMPTGVLACFTVSP